MDIIIVKHSEAPTEKFLQKLREIANINKN